MEPSKNEGKTDVTIKYFPVSDPLAKEADKNKPEATQCYVQVEASFERAQYEQLQGEALNKPKKENKSVLMLFADKSGSMGGAPFDTVKTGLIKLGDHIFSDSPDGVNSFTEVHTVWYESYIHPHVTKQKKDYVANLQSTYCGGGTNFLPCFEYLAKTLKEGAEDTSYSVVFLTDGQGSYHNNSLPDLKALCQDLETKENKPCAIYCMGFSSGHDAKLLNGLANAGSQLGNFIYIASGGDYVQKLFDSIEECLGQALQASSAQRLTIKKADDDKFKIAETLKEEYVFKAKEEPKADVQEEKKTDEKDEKKDGEEPQINTETGDLEEPIASNLETDWSSITYSCTMLVSKADLTSNALQLLVQLGGGIELEGVAKLVEVEDPPVAVRAMADLDYINRKTFELIQQIQSGTSSEQRKQALNQLQMIDENLDQRYEAFMKIKDRALKKKLTTMLMECKQRSSHVIGLLRGVQDLTYLSNAVIAQINDTAFKAVKREGGGHLQKMLDKRSLQNENLYDKMDKEIDQIVEKLDIDSLRTKYKAIGDDIGACTLSCNDVFDALEDGDCMCIGLDIDRPEAAIADASRLVIKRIAPTYATSESFLQAAKFKMQKENQPAQATGGFKGNQGQAGGGGEIIKGVGNEKITGILPLHLFDQHWWIAKRKIAPVLGFMTTLDVMGYSQDQLNTVPFLVLVKAIDDVKHEKTEVTERILMQVEDTCIHMMKQNKGLRKQIAEAVHAFVFPAEKTSTRTSDVVKSVKVLAAQFHCLLRQPDLKAALEEVPAIADFFLVPEKLQDMKNKFVRLAIEEQLRRGQRETTAESLAAGLEKMTLTDSTKFIDKTFAAVAKELEESKAGGGGDSKYAKYEAGAVAIAKKYGYAEELAGQVEEKKAGEIEEEKKEGEKKAEKIDIEAELGKYMAGQPFLTATSLKLVEETVESFHKRLNLVEIWIMAEKLLGTEIKGVYDLPGFAAKSEDDCKIILLAMLIQNALTVKNSQRKEAAEAEKLVDFSSAEEARQYLVKLVGGKVMNQIRSKESALIKKFQDGAMDVVLDEVLAAPDAFIAAAMMKANAMSIGRGDFAKAITMLSESAVAIPDLARKLIMLKTGFFIHRDLIDVNKPMQLSVRYKKTEDAIGLRLFCDSKAKLQPDQHMVNQKLVFKVWAKHVFGGTSLTAQQLENIFPEYSHKIQLYQNCCDETGKIVKNQEFYKQYKQKPHIHSKRGGIDVKDGIQKKTRKAYKDLQKQKKQTDKDKKM